MQTVIAVEDLRKTYQPKTRKAPEVIALDGISFEVPRGEFFGLLGIEVVRNGGAEALVSGAIGQRTKTRRVLIDRATIGLGCRQHADYGDTRKWRIPH